MPPRMFAENQFGISPPDRLRRHDLISKVVLQHSILVHASFVRKGVRSNNGLIRLYRDARDVADELTTGKEFFRLNACVNVAKGFGTCTQSHDHFFHRRIACTLAQSVDCDLDLSCPGANSGKDGLVIVAVNLDKDVNAAGAFIQQYAPPFKIAFDPAGKTAEAFGVEAMPSSFIVSRTGTITYAHQGFEQSKSKDLEEKIKDALKP